jgi:hypothetical protein
MESGITVELYGLRLNRNLMFPERIAEKEGRPEAAFFD